MRFSLEPFGTNCQVLVSTCSSENIMKYNDFVGVCGVVNNWLTVFLLGFKFVTGSVDKFVDYVFSHDIPLTPMLYHGIPYYKARVLCVELVNNRSLNTVGSNKQDGIVFIDVCQ